MRRSSIRGFRIRSNGRSPNFGRVDTIVCHICSVTPILVEILHVGCSSTTRPFFSRPPTLGNRCGTRVPGGFGGLCRTTVLALSLSHPRFVSLQYRRWDATSSTAWKRESTSRRLLHRRRDTQFSPSLLKEVLESVDSEPLCTGNVLKLIQWMSRYYLVSMGQIFEAVVPAGVRAQAGTKNRLMLFPSDWLMTNDLNRRENFPQNNARYSNS